MTVMNHFKTKEPYFMVCPECGEKVQDFCDKHNQEKPMSIVVVARDEGSFIGYRLTGIQTEKQLQKFDKLPWFQVNKPGIIEMEPVYKFAQKNDIWDYIVFCYVEPEGE